MSTTLWDTEPAAHPPTEELPAHTTERPSSSSPDHAPRPPFRGWDAPLPPTPPPTAPPGNQPAAPKKRGTGKVVAVLAGAAALIGAGFVARDVVANSSPGADTAASASGTGGPAKGQGVEQVAKNLSPAVVQITTGNGLGSGVVYDASGLVMTNAHVLNGASQVKVTMSGGKEANGQVIGTDPSVDIAVVKIDGTGVTVAPLASAKVAVGESVAAVGSPFGLQGTVTAGIVSAVDRPFNGAEDERGVATKMIQTDAPINPGNSGGALANIRGEVVGINTAIFSQKGENNGIGFAIPIETAKTVADKIVAGGGETDGGRANGGRSPQQVPRGNGNQVPGNGGSNGTPSNPQTAPGRAALGITLQSSADGGAVVGQVVSDSPAAEAGLRAGDVITGVDGEAIDSSADLQAAIASYEPGDQVTLEVQRGDQQGTVDVTLGAAQN